MVFHPLGTEPDYAKQDTELPNIVRVEKKGDIPDRHIIAQMDEQTMMLLERFDAEKKVTFTVERDNTKDFVVPQPDGSVMVVAETVTINGVQWFIKVGQNTLPVSVYEFWRSCPGQKQRMAHMAPGDNVCLGSVSR